MNTYLDTKVSNSSHKYCTRGAKAISCSLINLKPPEIFARPELSNISAKTDSESDWQEVNYKKKSVKSATKASKPQQRLSKSNQWSIHQSHRLLSTQAFIQATQLTGYREIAQ